ncbi:MAG: hypothetical protein M0R37_14710 [Bacteroidales bacterium]|jgi:hypothetical protein|nr:hypothetical protein [Bacteroidales bacterium]
MKGNTMTEATAQANASPTCGAHGPLVDKIDQGFRRMDEGFATVNRRMDDLFRNLGAREEADKTQGREIGELKKKAEAVPKMIDHLTTAKVAAHKEACAIGDITRTEVRLKRERDRDHRRENAREPESDDGFETPARGTRRTSFLPGGASFKIPRVVIWIGVILGVAVAAGGWALSMLLKVDLTDLQAKAGEMTGQARAPASAPADQEPSTSDPMALPARPQSTPGDL